MVTKEEFKELKDMINLLVQNKDAGRKQQKLEPHLLISLIYMCILITFNCIVSLYKEELNKT